MIHKVVLAGKVYTVNNEYLTLVDDITFQTRLVKKSDVGFLFSVSEGRDCATVAVQN